MSGDGTVGDGTVGVDASGPGEGGMISAQRIAETLGLPSPTEQQRRVIESPLEPGLVVAGAGSGKTETMASRVVWLLANGLVGIEEILGLTFTRKAAGELGVRIRARIEQLQQAELAAVPADAFATPTVQTYNAFANGIFRDSATLIGREAESVVLTEASAWQLARRLVVESTDPRLLELGRGVDPITQAVISLSRAMSENVADPAEVVRLAGSFTGLAELPFGSARIRKAPAADAVAAVGALPPLVDLAVRFQEEKTRLGLVESSDQVAFALAICERVPQVVAEHRKRFRVVLLDEYQDTSVVQTRLLATLFGGTPVMAVGDPHQSIYGWRGASAANLARFGADFAPAGASAADVPVYALST
ncbi:ATP-dependent helicase, partial [Clavibacter michiganensis subsp. insidiosus]